LWLSTARDPSEDAAVCPSGRPASTPDQTSDDVVDGSPNGNNNDNTQSGDTSADDSQGRSGTQDTNTGGVADAQSEGHFNVC
jgi:hypothetical protein